MNCRTTSEDSLEKSDSEIERKKLKKKKKSKKTKKHKKEKKKKKKKKRHSSSSEISDDEWVEKDCKFILKFNLLI